MIDTDCCILCCIISLLSADVYQRIIWLLFSLLFSISETIKVRNVDLHRVDEFPHISETTCVAKKVTTS